MQSSLITASVSYFTIIGGPQADRQAAAVFLGEATLIPSDGRVIPHRLELLLPPLGDLLRSPGDVYVREEAGDRFRFALHVALRNAPTAKEKTDMVTMAAYKTLETASETGLRSLVLPPLMGEDGLGAIGAGNAAGALLKALQVFWDRNPDSPIERVLIAVDRRHVIIPFQHPL